jgi:hypothetical protein
MTVAPIRKNVVPADDRHQPGHQHGHGKEAVFRAPGHSHNLRRRDPRSTGGNQKANRSEYADQDQHAGKLSEQRGNVGVHRQGFEVDDAQEKLAVEDAELQRQPLHQTAHEARHG